MDLGKGCVGVKDEVCYQHQQTQTVDDPRQPSPSGTEIETNELHRGDDGHGREDVHPSQHGAELGGCLRAHHGQLLNGEDRGRHGADREQGIGNGVRIAKPDKQIHGCQRQGDARSRGPNDGYPAHR